MLWWNLSKLKIHLSLGPLLLFDEDLTDFVIISPLNNFMVANQEVAKDGIR